MSMENNAKQLSNAAAIAQFKLAVIAPAIHGLYPDASRNAYYKRITKQPLTLPDGSAACYKPGTLAKWESLYRRGGIDALMPKVRSDSGGTRVLTDAAVDENAGDRRYVECVRQYHKYRRKRRRRCFCI